MTSLAVIMTLCMDESANATTKSAVMKGRALERSIVVIIDLSSSVGLA